MYLLGFPFFQNVFQVVEEHARVHNCKLDILFLRPTEYKCQFCV